MPVRKNSGKHKRVECLTEDGEDKSTSFSSVENQSLECSKCLEPNGIERLEHKGHRGIRQPIAILMISDNCFVNLSFEFEVLTANKGQRSLNQLN